MLTFALNFHKIISYRFRFELRVIPGRNTRGGVDEKTGRTAANFQLAEFETQTEHWSWTHHFRGLSGLLTRFLMKFLAATQHPSNFHLHCSNKERSK